jgi:L-serine dehydratase
MFSVAKAFAIPKEKQIMALLTASEIGVIIAENASISGAEGGCQAECGSASAMAAAACVEMLDGSPRMCSDAVALALKLIMGLVCDPVAGLVEVPCVKRNASGVINALTAASLALAGIQSVIPADEVIEAMNIVGQRMDCSLKETSLSGLAATPTAKNIEQNLEKMWKARI